MSGTASLYHRSVDFVSPVKSPLRNLPPPTVARALSAVVACSLFVWAPWSAASLEAQMAEVREEENLRAEPGGTILGRVSSETRLRVTGEDGDWVRVELHGWVWTPSLQVRDDDELDLVVSEPGGENLREEPQGRIMARLETGTLLAEQERVPGWIRIRREAWVGRASLELEEATEPALLPEAEGELEVEEEAIPVDEGWLRVPQEGEVSVQVQPDGDPLARLVPGSQFRVLDRQGNWARVELDGWVWLPGLEPGREGEGGLLRNVLPEEIPADPERFRGRLVELSLQFISLERAEQGRPEFGEGETFLLTRAEEGSRIFVYVAVPPDRLEEVEGLMPLESVELVARVRSPASDLTGSPVLDLLELGRSR